MNLKIFVKSYGFLSFAENRRKNLSGKCSAPKVTQEVLDSPKKSEETKVATDSLRTESNSENS